MENPGHSDLVISFRWRMSPARDTSPGRPTATPGDRFFSHCFDDQNLVVPFGNSLKKANPVKPFRFVRTVRLDCRTRVKDLQSASTGSWLSTNSLSF